MIRKGRFKLKARLALKGFSAIHTRYFLVPLYLLDPVSDFLYSFDVIVGVSVRAISKETDKVSVIIIGSDLIKAPVLSGIVAIGINAKTVVIVAVTTGHPISDAALYEASILLKPNDLKRSIFSTITIELSTSKPRATINPAIEICCRPNPDISKKPNPITMERGIASTTTSEDRNPNEKKITIPTRTIPWSRFSKKLLILFLTFLG